MRNKNTLSSLTQRIFTFRPKNVQEKNYPSFLPLNLVYIFGGFNHAGWVIVFFLLNVTPLSLFNILSVAIWICAFLLNRKGFHFTSYGFIVTEVCLHQTLCVSILGWDSGFQYWIFILPTGLFVLPQGRSFLKIVIVLFCFINFSCLYYFYGNLDPVNTVDPVVLNIINYGNIFMSIGVMVMGMFYFASKIHEARESLNKEQRKVKDAYSLLSKYVAPQLADTISDGQIDLIWQHNRKKLTLFFSDIKDFTTITDSLEPEDMASLLNDYLTEMNDIINKYEGTLAQVIGDGLYVFFGAPKSTNDKEHAIRCLKMAIDMQSKMRELNQKWFDIGVDEELQIRCGINTGMATVGGYGSSERKEYTAMGMQVNIAARLESACKPGCILINHTTWVLVKGDIPCLEKGQIEIKGYHLPIKIYEVEAS